MGVYHVTFRGMCIPWVYTTGVYDRVYRIGVYHLTFSMVGVYDVQDRHFDTLDNQHLGCKGEKTHDFKCEKSYRFSVPFRFVSLFIVSFPFRAHVETGTER